MDKACSTAAAKSLIVSIRVPSKSKMTIFASILNAKIQNPDYFAIFDNAKTGSQNEKTGTYHDSRFGGIRLLRGTGP